MKGIGLASLLAALAASGCASPERNPAETRTFVFRVTGMKGQPGRITDD